MGPTGDTVRQNVARYRKGLNLTYAQLARDLEERGHPIPPLGLRRIEAGERRVDVDDLTALALALDVNPNALLMPPVDGSQVPCGLTGYTLRDSLSTRDAWRWARSVISLTSEPVETWYNHPDGRRIRVWTDGFRQRVSPQRVSTAEERYQVRADWILRQVHEIKEDLEQERIQNEALGYDQDVHDRMDLIEELEALDPTDDSAWARREFDPAPPAVGEGVHA